MFLESSRKYKTMDRKTKLITGWFPKLKEDKNFKITSPYNIDYNCISWALGTSDMWTWPNPPEERDDAMTWQNALGYSEDINTFIAYFEAQGYSQCSINDQKEGTIALYTIGNNCKHAARRLANGLWTSKLGPWHDIQHSTPQSLEGDIYGKVYCYMNK